MGTGNLRIKAKDLRTMASLTDKEITKALKDAKSRGEDIYLTDAARARGVGRLRLRARSTGQGLFYFRYVDSAGKQTSIPIGIYDANGKRGLTLKKAREKAGEFSRFYQNGRHDLRAYLDDQDAQERARMESAARARQEEERQAKSGTLKALLKGYIAHLKRHGKSSASDAENLIRKNIFDADAFPHLAEMKAREITPEDVSAILSRLIERGAGRTSGKLRAYLRAAYAAALQAGHDPTIHPDLHGFHLNSNPAALVPAKAFVQYNVARERALNVSEMQAFLAALGELEAGLSKDVLELCLLLGGQRLAQLVRVTPEVVDLDAQTITLFDIKGARTKPRPHVLPLTERAAAIVERWLDRAMEDEDEKKEETERVSRFIFAGNRKVPIRVETISKVVSGISAAMVKAKTARASFLLRDIRRTCETMLAAMGISKDLRAQIQSHGLGGIQDRHYDRHHYMEEKRRALEAWDARLKEIASGTQQRKVVPMRRKGKA